MVPIGMYEMVPIRMYERKKQHYEILLYVLPHLNTFYKAGLVDVLFGLGLGVEGSF